MKDSAEVFSCRRCGFCCRGSGGIVLRGCDEERLCAALHLSLAEFRARCTMRRGEKILLRSGVDGACIFFSDGPGGAGCDVHANRPDICRAWPFFRGNLIDAYSLLWAKESCPGIRSDVSFDCFAREGKAHLLREGLAAKRTDARSPSALIIDGDETP